MILTTVFLRLLLASGTIAGGRQLHQGGGLGEKILDGQDAGDGEFPYVVSLRLSGSHGPGKGNHFCGGTLIDSNIVLTAAHCLQTDNRPTVNVGSVERSGGQSFGSLETIVHPGFKKVNRGFDYDVALILIDGSAPQTKSLLGSSDECFVSGGCSSDAVTVGWGLTNENDPTSFSNRLQKVSVPPVLAAKCKELMNTPPDRITSRMICAGRGGPDSCQGDSGGPILMGGKQIGITSFGDGCGAANSPGVYASIPAVFDWINSEKEVLKSKASPPPTPTSPPTSPGPTEPEPDSTPPEQPDESNEQKDTDSQPTTTPPPVSPPTPQTSGSSRGGECVFRHGVFIGNCKK